MLDDYSVHLEGIKQLNKFLMENAVFPNMQSLSKIEIKSWQMCPVSFSKIMDWLSNQKCQHIKWARYKVAIKKTVSFKVTRRYSIYGFKTIPSLAQSIIARVLGF